MELDINKIIALTDEIQNAIGQINNGLQKLQTVPKSNEIRFSMFQSLSTGFERLLKYGICYGEFSKNNKLPKAEEIRTHNISNLLNRYINDYFSTPVPVLISDYKFLTTDDEVKMLIKILSDFGENARYYNLNVVTDYKYINDIQPLWDKLVTTFIMNNDKVKKAYVDEPDYKYVDDEVIKHFVSIFEKLTRAIVRQFTLGNIKDAGKDICSYYHFLTLMDNKLGATNYYLQSSNVEKEKQQKYKPINGNKRKVISKAEYVTQFKKLWPFKNTDIVMIKKAPDGCIFIVINDNIYALNGITEAKYNLPFAYQYEGAFLGRDVSDFLNMAFDL